MVFRTQRRVEFRDTDAAGIMHFSAFFPMMEAAEHEMLRSVSIPVMPRLDQYEADDPSAPEPVTWPRVSASCDFKSAVRFEDVLKISVEVVRMGQSSIQYGIRFECEGRLVAEGQLTAVCCRVPTGHPGEGLQKVPIPDSIRVRLSQGEAR